MTEQERRNEPAAEEPPTDPPAAVQWMMQQAAAGQSAAALPVAASDRLTNSLSPTSTGDEAAEKTLAARRQRVADALRGNDRLTAGLSGEAADALMAWGLELSQAVVDDTAGLDDAAAEDVLQPRVRAVRRLMMAAAAATGDGPTDAAEWLAQAAVALGDRFAPPNAAQQAALAARWLALTGRPVEQIAALRCFIEQPDLT